ncbi:TonB-dependent receptor [Pedobacter yulinensis]|uniref:TonB-dependent receptor n=1 Tax=Pedobacter yulinensis TaxID=2126353 RepID=A0A2T3HQZ9_9SPHI|nr:outer membrane beta-barrel protein [Pedobacter yulinensis]PST84846.1 TonB-dependent receptor [Pedobacter yulinensis]
MKNNFKPAQALCFFGKGLFLFPNKTGGRFLAVFVVFCGLLLSAEKSRAQKTNSVSGKVTDATDGTAVPGATVLIYAKASEQSLASALSDENGVFRLNGMEPGIYRLRVSYVGYAPFLLNDVALNKDEPEKRVGTIKMSPDQNNLAEVTVTAEKPTLEFGADMITYNVGNSVLAEGSTATDILKNVPMVEVDIDGNASISGKRSTRIFIDGKPSDYMSSNIADLLNVLPSDAIEKIEVMTNPPVKYSGDGEGVINIVLKKGFKIGFTGNVGVTAGLQGNMNTNANASYKAKTWSMNGGLAYRENLGRRLGTVFRENFFPDTTFYYDQHNTSRTWSNGGNARVGFDWDITPAQNLRISSNYNMGGGNTRSQNDFGYLNEARVQTRLRNQMNESASNSSNFVASADYSIEDKTSGEKFSAGLNVNTNDNDADRTFERRFAYPANLSPSLQQNSNATANNGINATADYDRPVRDKKDRLELGAQYNFRKNNNDLQVENFDFAGNRYLINPRLTNQFLYRENILAAYASYNFRENGWSVKTGVRSELTNVKFDLSGGDQYNVRPYLSVFPNLSVNRFFRKRYNIGATYSVRINRPRENTLNPQIDNSDSLNITYGNPLLVPAYTHQTDVSFGMFGQKWSFTPRIAYSTARGVIERYRQVRSNGISESTYQNIGMNNNFSLILVGNYRPTKTISTNGHFSLINSDYVSALNQSLNRNGLSLRGSLGFSMQLPFKTAFEGNLNYANNVNAQGRARGSVTSSFAARKVFMKNRLHARIWVSDPFGQRSNEFFNEGLNFRSQSFSESNTNNITFSLGYRFTRVAKQPSIPPPAVK